MGTPAENNPKHPNQKADLLTPDKLAMVKKSKLPLFKVNLLIHKGEQIKLQQRLLRWVLSSGRFFVIVVELLTIGAFVYRYKLDGDLADIQDQIKEEVLYIQSLKHDEELIRQTQFQLNTIKQIKNSNLDYSSILWKIAQITPKNTRLTNLTFNRPPNLSQVSFSLTGQTSLSFELSAFIRALQSDPVFANITLTNVSFENETNFTITGNLTGKGIKTS